MLDLSRIRAITLDLDDTLWPVWPTIHRAEAVLQDWLQQHAPAAAVLSAQPDIKKAIRTDINARHADRAHDLSFLRREAIRALLQAAGEPSALAVAGERLARFGDRVRLFRAVITASQRVWPALAVRAAARLFLTPLPPKWVTRRRRWDANWRVESWPFEGASLTVYSPAAAAP